MGSTRRTQSNTTNQVDSRRIYQTEIDYEHRIDDSFNNETRFDVRDESAGNISAGGNVTVESEAASVAASKAAADQAAETRKIAEANAKLQAELADQQRRTNEANAKLEEERAKRDRDIAIANANTQAKFAEEQRRASEKAFSANTSVSTAAITETSKASERAIKSVVDISEEALERNSAHVAEVLAAGNENLDDTLAFLEKDEAEDRKLIESNFDFLGERIDEANKLTTTAVTEAFKSSIGGLADEQQQTLLIGLAIVAGLVALLAWRKS